MTVENAAMNFLKIDKNTDAPGAVYVIPSTL